MGKNPREPKAVKALIAKHTKKPKAATPHIAEGGRVIPTASLWSRLRLRKK